MPLIWEAASVAIMVGFWFLLLWTLMLGAWCAVDRYQNGTQKDRRVIGSLVLLLAVSLWAITTFR
jgi:hypothetical protein